MKQLIIISFLFLSIGAHAQFKEPEKESEAFSKVEVVPEFPGGMQAFYSYIAQNMEYPDEARRLGIEGRVYIQYEIDKDGYVDTASVKTVRGLHSAMNLEAERVIKQMPQWSPGRLTEGGEAVRVRMVIPIIYRLTREDKKKKGKNKN